MRSWFLATVMALAVTGCQWIPERATPQTGNPQVELDVLLRKIEAARKDSPDSLVLLEEEDVIVDPQHLRIEADRLAVRFPHHVPTLMTCAILAYESDQRTAAQRFLDRALAIDAGLPDAAILRAQIALADGNVRLARRVVESAIERRPDLPQLRETHAGVLFLLGEYDRSTTAVDAAISLGAPAGRAHYHLGLIAERSGDVQSASLQYQEALLADPGFEDAAIRLRGLQVK